MKYTLVVVFSLIYLSSCKESTHNEKEITKEKLVVAEYQSPEKKQEGYKEEARKQQQIACEEYYKTRYPNDSLKAIYIDDILSKSKLSKNNFAFLTALKNEKQKGLAFQNVLSPIFRFSRKEIGIVTSPKYKHIGEKHILISKEGDYINEIDTTKTNAVGQIGKITFYPTLLTSIQNGKSKPKINYYTTTNTGETQLLELGYYGSECLEYYEYSLDTTNISINDKVLFSSPFAIDLVYENNPKIDLLLRKDYKEECSDCPNSSKLQKTFAKVKGTDNVYFVFADTFPINNQLETPSRALVSVNDKNKVIYLWYDDIDLVGCSCI